MTSTRFRIVVLLGFVTLLPAERLFSPFYSVHYSKVKGRIANPQTPDCLYPDTLSWSSAGSVSYGLQVLLDVDRPTRSYRTNDLIGVRCGIRNCTARDVSLAVASYSPNKRRSLPDYTLYIEGPRQRKLPYIWLGDDIVILSSPPPQQFAVPPAGVFNPSPDSLYYNAGNGILRFKTPGRYALWVGLGLDSLSTSVKLDKPHVTIWSDTVFIRVRPRFLGLF